MLRYISFTLQKMNLLETSSTISSFTLYLSILASIHILCNDDDGSNHPLTWRFNRLTGTVQLMSTPIMISV
jgi:hypothetical protein